MIILIIFLYCLWYLKFKKCSKIYIKNPLKLRLLFYFDIFYKFILFSIDSVTTTLWMERIIKQDLDCLWLMLEISILMATKVRYLSSFLYIVCIGNIFLSKYVSSKNIINCKLSVLFNQPSYSVFSHFVYTL